jgi:pimeloyl-ACP methyl ester carboxylesterase
MISAAGTSLHVQALGPPQRDEAARPTVVMLHGLFVGTLATWYFTAAPSLARDRRVIAYDLRGHGKSERVRQGYDVATMAGDLAAVTDAMGAHSLDLVGHSYGALVALRFALDRPERVRRLVLIEAPLPPSRFRELDELTSRSPEDMLAALPEAMRGMLTSGGRRARRLLESFQFLASETTLLADLRREPDLADAELGRVRCPVLCVYGHRSSCRDVGDRLVRTIPGARLEVLSGGHFLPLEAPGPLTHLLAEFLDG